MNTLSPDAALRVQDLSVWHGQSALVQGIDFSIARGGVMTLLGESGSGKSLLAQAIMGNLPGSLRCSGQIEIDGERSDAADAALRQRGWGRRIALLPQEPWLALDPTMTVARQVAETYELVSHPAADTQDDSLRAARKAARTLAGQALATL